MGPIDSTLLASLIAGGETSSVEFKVDIPQQADNLADEIASLATSGGGRILIGVDDSGTIVGITEARPHVSKERVEGIAKNVAPLVQLNCSYVPIEGMTVLCVEILRGTEPIYYSKGRPKLRQGSVSRTATPDEAKELILRHDALVRAARHDSSLGSTGIVAAGIAGQGELATKNMSDVVKHLRRASRQRLA